MRKIFRVGINDANYAVMPIIDGKQMRCPFYRKWCGMLRRCYCPNYLAQRPTYQGCVVCDEWLYFSNFKEWMETQGWEDKQLDKDFFGDGSIYSPSTCCFVEQWLNSLFNGRAALRGLYPIGVSKHKNRFRARLKINGHGTHIGYFDTSEEASTAYQKAKRQHVIDKMKDYPDQRIKQAVLAKVGVYRRCSGQIC